nr:hypothetical protein [Tanacetum cinerariifolium]
MRPFGCSIPILNTLDLLRKFDGKANKGFLVGYFISSKAFRVFNSRTRIVQETLYINVLENQPNVAGSGPKWLFDIDTLTQFQRSSVVKEAESAQQYVLLPLWSTSFKNPQNTDADAAFDDKETKCEVHVSPSSSDKPKKHDEKVKREAKGKSHVYLSTGVRELSDEFEEFSVNSTNRVNAASAPIPTVGPISTNSTNSFNAPSPFDNGVSPNFKIDDEEDVGAEADFSNLETSITVSPIPTTRVHKDHYVTQIIGDLSSAPQTRSMKKMVKEQGGLTQINYEDFHTCMFACFLSQEQPKRVHQALKDPSWIEAMQEEILQFKMQKVWVLVDLPKEEGIDYEEVFALIARIEAISHDKYVAKILRKFSLIDGKSASTPIDTEKPLLKDLDVKSSLVGHERHHEGFKESLGQDLEAKGLW